MKTDDPRLEAPECHSKGTRSISRGQPRLRGTRPFLVMATHSGPAVTRILRALDHISLAQSRKVLRAVIEVHRDRPIRRPRSTAGAICTQAARYPSSTKAELPSHGLIEARRDSSYPCILVKTALSDWKAIISLMLTRSRVEREPPSLLGFF